MMGGFHGEIVFPEIPFHHHMSGMGLLQLETHWEKPPDGTSSARLALMITNSNILGFFLISISTM